MENKKISFGFKKTKKVDKAVIEEKKEFIECVEEKSIKIKGGDIVEVKVPLSIKMKPNSSITAERLKQIADEVEKAVEEPDPPPQAKKEKLLENSNSVSPLVTAGSERVVIGEGKESSLDDYQSVPIEQFGLAMLRGMGWTPAKDLPKYKAPQLRPKGLGLGADKVIKENQTKNESEEKKDEELIIVKDSYVKITAGRYNGCCGKVVSMDEDNGRVLVNIAVKNETVSLSEFMMQPITKSQYDKESKIINADQFEQFKRKESSSSKEDSRQLSGKESYSSSKLHKRNKEKERYRNGDNMSSGRESSGEEMKHSREQIVKRRSRSRDVEVRTKDKNKEKTRDDSCKDTHSANDNRTKHQTEHKRRYESSDSESSVEYKKKSRHRSKTPDEKRDIDKKRKGKKKKRDRDRSPHYRKHKNRS